MYPTAPTETAQLTCRLAAAEEALHKLQLGQLATEVEVDGRRVRYARTDIDALQGYVDKLRELVAGVRPRTGAIGFLL